MGEMVNYEMRERRETAQHGTYIRVFDNSSVFP